MGKIATWGYILNDLGWGGSTSKIPDVNENQCPTKSEINNYCGDGVIINGNYANNQLVQESDLELGAVEPKGVEFSALISDGITNIHIQKKGTGTYEVLNPDQSNTAMFENLKDGDYFIIHSVTLGPENLDGPFRVLYQDNGTWREITNNQYNPFNLSYNALDPAINAGGGLASVLITDKNIL